MLLRSVFILFFFTLSSALAVDTISCRVAVSYQAELDPKGLVPQIRRWTKQSLIERSAQAYNLKESDILSYYNEVPETRGLFSVRFFAPSDQLYTVNSRGEIQAKDWYKYTLDLKAQQMRWSFDVDAFIRQQGTEDLNSAKVRFYSQLNFDMKTFRHELPYSPMKEWSSLNHPPIHDISPRDLPKYSKHFKPIDYQSSRYDRSRYFDVQFHKRIDKSTKSQLTRGNRFKLLEDNDSQTERIKYVDQAERSIYMSSLVFTKEATVEKLVDALIRAAKRGVDVRIMSEWFMSAVHPAMLKKMEQNGVKVIRTNELFKYNTQAIYHSKVFVVDGKIAIIGGINQLDADVGSRGTDMKNRDLDVATTGPIVTDIVYHFMEEWNHFAGKKKWFGSQKPLFTNEQIQSVLAARRAQEEQGLRGENNYEAWLSDPQQRMTGLARYISQKPYEDVSVITRALIEYLDGVTEYLGITNPQALDTRKEDYPQSRGLRLKYDSFKNFNMLFDKIAEIMKQRRDVHVDVITSGAEHTVNEAGPLTRDRIRDYLDRGAFLRANMNQNWLDRTNIKWAPTQYKNLMNDFGPYPQVNTWIHVSFIHSKVMSFDRLAVSIGSFNPHHNATDHAYESTLMIQDARFSAEIDRALVLDMANSVPLTFKEKKE